MAARVLCSVPFGPSAHNVLACGLTLPGSLPFLKKLQHGKLGVPPDATWISSRSCSGACQQLFSTATASASGSPSQLPQYSFLGSLADSIDDRPAKKQRFVDRLRLTVQAGKGGSGCVSFWKSQSKGKFRPPDGGNGGDGGDVVLEASSKVKSLNGLNHLHKAEPGANGGKQKMYGIRGKDAVIQVPLGTVVSVPRPAGSAVSEEEDDFAVPKFMLRDPSLPYTYDSEEDTSGEEDNDARAQGWKGRHRQDEQELVDLAEEGLRFLLARGGAGGRGNASYRTGQNRPGSRESTKGEPGERVTAILEVRVLADVGLVGAPNAGKSSLLRALSAASPKVAAYPFTTLQPHLGNVHYDEDFSLTVADIPGLIPGAAENRGLGHAFLRHISRAQALVYVLDLSGGLAGNEGPRPWEQLASLQEELRLYNESLAAKPAIVVANKLDKVVNKEARLAALRRRTNLPVLPVSAIQGPTGLGDLKQHLRQLAEAAAKAKLGKNSDTDSNGLDGLEDRRPIAA